MNFGSWLSIIQKEGVNFPQVSGFFSPDKSRVKVTVTFLWYSYFFFPFVERVEMTLN